ncbi:glycosyltransferase family 2 protein [Flavobacterium sp. J49]|uniref:glycosyltransferase family 2 protein n=1 Tax=Flavobacterium sp. J49 TaxID=2718534 RepID=UPI0015944812|nr:glycosyltransferase family 2 protein [Flavobacterium sp. J49]MBF6642502.1 glycosyltransferase family 2 protein [Flavobacterium sp. J49]NIC03748.1 glycosyltransferase family 2 protein [Flavobacterium sp. J49]
MQLSVIILNYNVRYFLELCVLSVQKAIQNLDAEIIVIDNNSSDDSCAMMKQRFPNVKLIENKENSGFPKGNNIAVREAKGEYLCILNPDTVVSEDTFEKLLSFVSSQAQSRDDLGIVGCKLIDGTGNFLPESKRGIPTPWVAFTKIFGLYKIFPKSSMFNKYYAQDLAENQTGKVDILVGAFMVMKRELYNELGGFDENCFMYADDIDLSYRALLLQKQNCYFHETTVIHYKGESTVKDATYMKHFRGFMNYFYQKHFKRSLFFNLMARFGAFYFSIVKVFKGKSQPKVKPNQYILVSDNEALKEKLATKLQKSVERTLLENGKIVISQTISKAKNTEVILDTNYLGFKKAIAFLEENKNKSFTFKLLPIGSNFIIGSNSSNDRGEVINL